MALARYQEAGPPATGFIQVLHSLESGTPRLFVDNLNVLAQRMYFAPGVRNPGEGGLDVSFDLYGYLPPSVEVSRAR